MINVPQDAVGNNCWIIQLMAQLIKEEQVEIEEKESDLASQERSQREGIWNDEQLLKFMIFTHFNKEIMSSKLQRRTLKIFKKMAVFIQTRSSIQCRSQNQKLIKKYKSINKILKVYIDKIGPEQFNTHCLAYSKHPDVKYIINETPPKQSAGHAVSISTQTDFMDSDESPLNHRNQYVSKVDQQYP